MLDLINYFWLYICKAILVFIGISIGTALVKFLFHDPNDVPAEKVRELYEREQ